MLLHPCPAGCCPSSRTGWDCFLGKSWEMPALLSAFCKASCERKGAPSLKPPIQGEMFPTTQRVVFSKVCNPVAELPKTGHSSGTVQHCGCDLPSHGVAALAGASHSTGHTCMSSRIWDKITCKAQMRNPSPEKNSSSGRKNKAETSLGLIATTSSCPPDKAAHSLPGCAAVQSCITPQPVGLAETSCEWGKPSWLLQAPHPLTKAQPGLANGVL